MRQQPPTFVRVFDEPEPAATRPTQAGALIYCTSGAFVVDEFAPTVFNGDVYTIPATNFSTIAVSMMTQVQTVTTVDNGMYTITTYCYGVESDGETLLNPIARQRHATHLIDTPQTYMQDNLHWQAVVSRDGNLEIRPHLIVDGNATVVSSFYHVTAIVGINTDSDCVESGIET